MPLFCPDCEASNPKNAQFCGECGQSLATPAEAVGGLVDQGSSGLEQIEPVVKRETGAGSRETAGRSTGRGAAGRAKSSRRNARGSSGKNGNGDEPIDRTTAHRELVRLRTSIDRIRVLYLTFAMVTGLLAALIGIVLLRDTGSQDPIVGWVTFAVLIGFTVLFLVGRQRIGQHPYFWGVLSAALVTLVVLVEWAAFFAGGISFSRGLVIHTILAAAVWGAAATLASAKKMMDAHPELRIAKRIRGEDTRVSENRGEIAQREFERRKQAKRNTLIGVGIAGAILVGFFLIPPLLSEATAGGSTASSKGEGQAEITASFDPIRTEFEAAWAARDIARIGELYPDHKSKYRRRLARRFDKHDLQDFPVLGEPRILETQRTRRELVYSLDTGQSVTLEIAYEQERWVMNRLLMQD